MNKELIKLNLEFKDKLNSTFMDKGIFIPYLNFYLSVDFSLDYNLYDVWVNSSEDGELFLGAYTSTEEGLRVLRMWLDMQTKDTLHNLLVKTLQRGYSSGYSEHFYL